MKQDLRPPAPDSRGRAIRKNDAAPENEPVAPAASGIRDARPVIVAFGDSLTSGFGVDPDRNYPSGLQKKIEAAGFRHRVVNAGISGETSDQGLARLQTVMDLHPAVVIVELGANDGLLGLPIESTRQNIVSIVRRLQSAKAEVILAGMQVPPDFGPEYTKAFRDIFREVAEQCRVPLIPFLLDGVGGNAALNQEDGIHPTAHGYEIVVKNVWKVLEPMLRGRSASND